MTGLTRLAGRAPVGLAAAILCAFGAARAADPREPDPLPEGVVRLGTPRFQDFTIGGAIAFSPDSRLLAIGGANPPVCVWDAVSGRLARTHPGGGSVLDLRWRPAGRLRGLTFFGFDAVMMNEWGDDAGPTDRRRQDLRRAA